MKILGILSGLFIAIFLFINRSKSILLNLSDATFILSLIYLMISMVIYVRNIGLFKTFAYNSYRRTVRKKNKQERKEEEKQEQGFKDKVNEKIEGIDPRDEDMLEFHEFTQEKYSVQWSNKKYIIGAIVMFLLSQIFIFFL